MCGTGNIDKYDPYDALVEAQFYAAYVSHCLGAPIARDFLCLFGNDRVDIFHINACSESVKNKDLGNMISTFVKNYITYNIFP